MNDKDIRQLCELWLKLPLSERHAVLIIVKALGGRRGPQSEPAAEPPKGPLPVRPGAVAYGRIMERIDEEALVEALRLTRRVAALERQMDGLAECLMRARP